MTNRTSSYMLSVRISLCIKKPSHFGYKVYKSLMKTNPNLMRDLYFIKPGPYDLRTAEKLHLLKFGIIYATLWPKFPDFPWKFAVE